MLGASLALAGGLAACAGNDETDAESTVKDFVTATNRRDTALCDRLVTQKFLEQTLRTKGESARRACKKQLKAVRGLELRIESFKKTEVEGDRAEVTVEIDANGVKQERTLKLVKDGERFRIDGSDGPSARF